MKYLTNKKYDYIIVDNIMKGIMILMLYVGITMIIVGYMKNYQKCDEPKIEYRYVPRTFFEEQIAPTDLKKSFSGMFNDQSTWLSYPFNGTTNVEYNKQNYDNFIKAED